MLSVSLAVTKKRKQCLWMSPESKEVQKKERNRNRQAESANVAAKQKIEEQDSKGENV